MARDLPKSETLVALVGRVLTSDRLALSITATVSLIVISVRYIHAWLTGYLLPDEAYYYDSFVLDRQFGSNYRIAFKLLFAAFFNFSHSVPSLLVTGYLWSTMWALGVIVVLRYLLVELDIPTQVRSMIILSLPFIAVFVVMVPFFLTETMGLFFALLGSLFVTRYLKAPTVQLALLASVCFAIAFETREPYIFFAVGNFVTVFLATRKEWRKNVWSWVAYAVPLLVVIPIPTQISVKFLPATTQISITRINFSQPILTYVRSLLQLSTASEAARPTFGVAVSNSFIDFIGSLQAFVFSVALGYNPILAVAMVLSIALAFRSVASHRNRLTESVLWNQLVGLLAVFISVVSIISSVGWLYIGGIFRISHPSLVGFPLLSSFYGKFKPRMFLGLVLIIITIGAITIPSYSNSFEGSLSTGPAINRVSLAYRAPYFRLYEIVKNSSNVLVIGGIEMRAVRVYLSMLPNVVLVGTPKSQFEFDSLINRGWSAIYLYDNYYTISPQFENAYPSYYWRILTDGNSYGAFRIQPIWVDSESYCLKLSLETP